MTPRCAAEMARRDLSATSVRAHGAIPMRSRRDLAQLSWVCLGRMSAVSHSIANALRRPATIGAALLVAPTPLTPTNAAGMTLACLAALVYGLIP